MFRAGVVRLKSWLSVRKVFKMPIPPILSGITKSEMPQVIHFQRLARGLSIPHYVYYHKFAMRCH